jgi:hypothetical protein
VRALCTIDPTSSVVKDYGDELAHSHTALMPTLSMEATADLLDIPSPWTAESSVLIKPTDLDMPADPVTGTSGFLLSLPVDRRWHVRQCAFHKETLDGQLYAAGAKFLAGSNAATYGIMPGIAKGTTRTSRASIPLLTASPWRCRMGPNAPTIPADSGASPFSERRSEASPWRQASRRRGNWRMRRRGIRCQSDS